MMEWKREKLGAYCNIISGYAFKSQDLKSEGDIPIIKIGTISNGGDLIIDDSMQFVSSEFLKLNTKFHVFYGDVLISLTGSHINNPNSVVGKSCRNYSKKLYLLNQRAGKIVANHSDCLNYIFYLLQSKSIKENIATRAYGAANQANVSPFDILGIKCEFPSIKAMKVIGDYLSKYDLLIQTNNKRIRILEQMAENLYKEWFVRFRFPGHENAEFENGLPKGWEVKKVQDWCIVFTGKKDVNQTNPDGKYTFFSCSPDTFKSNDYIYDGKAILVAGNGSYTGRTRYFEGKFDLYQRTYAIVSKRDDSDFLYYLYTRFKFDFEKIYSGGTRGSAIPYIVMKDLTRYKFLYEETIVMKFISIIRPMFQQMDLLKEECLFLARQCDLLLPRLMSGKLEVKV